LFFITKKIAAGGNIDTPYLWYIQVNLLARRRLISHADVEPIEIQRT